MLKTLRLLFSGSALIFATSCSAGDYPFWAENEASCNNGHDDDNDGKTDGDDEDCRCTEILGKERKVRKFFNLGDRIYSSFPKLNYKYSDIEDNIITLEDDAIITDYIKIKSEVPNNCKLGIRECRDEGNGKFTWVEITSPQTKVDIELCGNDIDDDCDGVEVKNNDMTGRKCASCSGNQTKFDYPMVEGAENFTYGPKSECKIGFSKCGSDGNWITTEYPNGIKKPEECNGKDDNCDGQIDELSLAKLISKFYLNSSSQEESLDLQVGSGNCWDEKKLGVCKGIGSWTKCKEDNAKTPECTLTQTFIPSADWYAKPNFYIPAAFFYASNPAHLQTAKWDRGCDGKVDHALCLPMTSDEKCTANSLKTKVNNNGNVFWVSKCSDCSAVTCPNCVVYPGTTTPETCGTVVMVNKCVLSGTTCSLEATTTPATVVCQ